jgi:hypothetical protein
MSGPAAMTFPSSSRHAVRSFVGLCMLALCGFFAVSDNDRKLVEADEWLTTGRANQTCQFSRGQRPVHHRSGRHGRVKTPAAWLLLSVTGEARKKNPCFLCPAQPASPPRFHAGFLFRPHISLTPSNYPGKWDHRPPSMSGHGEVEKPSGKNPTTTATRKHLNRAHSIGEQTERIARPNVRINPNSSQVYHTNTHTHHTLLRPLAPRQLPTWPASLAPRRNPLERHLK